jgi:hypothetical protein
MAGTHWLDALSEILAGGGSRRAVLVAAGALASGRIVRGMPLTEARGRRRRWRRRRNNAQPIPPSPPPAPLPPPCTSTRFDNNHCGVCGNVCPQGTTCHDGECIDLRCVSNTTEPGFENWTQYCGDRCIPDTALCCGSYYCWDPREIECCFTVNETCGTAEEPCSSGPPPP